MQFFPNISQFEVGGLMDGERTDMES
jgi:hypothetical protein